MAVIVLVLLGLAAVIWYSAQQAQAAGQGGPAPTDPIANPDGTLGLDVPAPPDGGGIVTDPTQPAPPPASDIPAALPGDPHDWDNQFVYAASYVNNADPLFPLALKAIAGVESGYDPTIRGDYTPGTPAYQGDPTTENYCSLGLMQINRCAHPDLAQRYNLLDPNDSILAAAEVLQACWARNLSDPQSAIRCYNGGGWLTYIYLGKVLARLRPLADAAGLVLA